MIALLSHKMHEFSTQYTLEANGIALDSVMITKARRGNTFTINCNDPDDSELLLDEATDNFQNCSQIRLDVRNGGATQHRCRVLISRAAREKSPPSSLTFHIDLQNWNLPLAPIEACTIVRDAAIALAGEGSRRSMQLVANDASFAIALGRFDPWRPIREVVAPWLDLLARAFQEVERRCAEAGENRLVLPIAFPEAVRAPCEQYLVYFAQFLRDLGVEADAEMKHEPGGVLFTVTPKSGAEALGKIREALDCYLGLPGASSLDLAGPSGVVERVQMQQVMANVAHYRSQLLLSTAMLEMKDAQIDALRDRIEAKEERIELLRRAQAGSVMEVSEAVHPPAKAIAGPQATESILTVKHYEMNGLSINLPLLWRRFKEAFNQDFGYEIESRSPTPRSLSGQTDERKGD